MITKKDLTLGFWIIGVILLGLVSRLICDWPHLSQRALEIIDSLSYALIGVLLPLLWINGRKAHRRERFLMGGLMAIVIVSLCYYTHFRIVTIRVVGNSYGGLEDELKEFNAANRGIVAKLVDDWGPLNTDERYNKMLNYIKGVDRADILELDGIWMEFAMNAPRGVLLPLNSFYEQDMAERHFLTAALNGARHRKTRKLYGVPLYVDVGLIFYRKDLLGKLPDPVSLQTLEDTIPESLAKTKRKGLLGFIFQSARYEGLNCFFLELLYSEGASIVGNGGKIRINSDKAKYMLKKLHDMVYKSSIVPPSVLVFEEEESRKLFTSGHALVLRSWPYVLQCWEDSAMIRQEDIGVTSFVTPVLGGWYLGIAKETKHPKEAWEVIKFLANPGTLYSRAKNPDKFQRRIPADMDELVRLRTHFAFLPYVEWALHRAKCRPRRQDYKRFSDVVSRAVFRILSDANATEETINNTLDKAQKKIRYELIERGN